MRVPSPESGVSLMAAAGVTSLRTLKAPDSRPSIGWLPGHVVSITQSALPSQVPLKAALGFVNIPECFFVDK